MEFIKNLARNYWIAYYLVYVGGVAVGLCRYWRRLPDDDGILWMAAIFGASAGFALTVAILLEVIGRMVLLIPAAIEKLKEEGRKEGRMEGRKEGRRGVIAALVQRGGRADGSIQVNLTPEEVNALLQEYDARSG